MGEVPTEAAKRELAEETGLSTQNIVYLGAFNQTPQCFRICVTYLPQTNW